jgi:SAM-dependent methyltransferase
VARSYLRWERDRPRQRRRGAWLAAVALTGVNCHAMCGMAADREAYWQSASEDTTMQDEHAFMWAAMLDTIDVDLTGRRVLDAGCNRGGFLRLVCERARIDAGFGYDPAPAAIADARRLAGERPLTFEPADTVPPGWGGFDVAFSHEVLYLLHDLDAHARAIRRALAPGGVYYAVIGVHAASPGVAEWHAENARSLNLPRLYALDDVIAAFTGAGLEAAAAGLKFGFVPLSGHAPSFPAGLEYFYEHKVMLRFSRPLSDPPPANRA